MGGAVAATGLRADQIVHDYWLIRVLSDMVARLSQDGGLRSGLSPRDAKRGRTAQDMPVVAYWAFTGGTSLSAAWEISPRFSEDIDARLFADEGATTAALRRVRRIMTTAAEEAAGAKTTSRDLAKLTRSEMMLPTGRTLVIDHAVEQGGNDLIRRSRVRSMLARYCPDPDGLCEQFPEAGGLVVPVVDPACIAVNKLDALHRRASTGREAALALRYRDVFDLFHIARSDHADATRRAAPTLWPRMNIGFGPAVDRPAGGYGTSSAFTPDTAAYNALRIAYNAGIGGLSCVAPPTFEEAVAEARSLDRP